MSTVGVNMRCSLFEIVAFRTPGGTRTLQSNEDLVEAGDLDALTKRIESLCSDGAWALVVDIRDRCRAALSRGKQLWPAAAYADYRVALDAPAMTAVSVLDSPAERFALGPFAEVLASRHRFEEMAAHLGRGPSQYGVAHERVVRGEDLRAYKSGLGDQDPFGLPLVLAPWEPAYTVPTYEPARLLAPTPPLPTFGQSVEKERQPQVRRLTSESESENALRELVSVWLSQSNGRSEVVSVEGSAADAVAALGCRHYRLGPLTASRAIDWMAWAAASGGAHGRRRGMAAGRHSALWALLELAGVAEPDLVVSEAVLEELAEALPEFRFYAWDDGAPATGWSLRIAIEDTSDGVAWALNAADARLD